MELSYAEVDENLPCSSTVDPDQLTSDEEERERGDEGESETSCEGANNESQHKTERRIEAVGSHSRSEDRTCR